MGGPAVRSERERAAAREDTLAQLAATRAEIRRLLEPPPPQAAGEAGGEEADAAGSAGAFPRSRTMRTLLSARGLGTLGAVIGSVFIARPALALKLVRLIPAGTVARMLLIKGFASLRTKREGQVTS